MNDRHNEKDDINVPYRATKIRRLNNITNYHTTSPPPPPQQQQQRMTTITCYHASVAQKSYGTEKRFLCPPPLVSINTNGADNTLKTSQPLVSMAVMCEGADRFLEQKIQLGDTQRGSFKYLHVTGTAKAKQFYLRVRSSPPLPCATQPYLTFFSNPISIISKPSKKTSKARNVSTCILANSPVSLYNRINSQTVRTKYMSSEHGNLCAKNTNWSPFEIVVLRQSPKDDDAASISDEVMSPQGAAYAATVNYGSEILLRDMQTGVESPPMIIRKVDKGRVVEAANGPVSQMQKVALQLATTARGDDQGMYLLATGQPVTPPANQEDLNSGAATWLDFMAARKTRGSSDDAGGVDDLVDRVDDYLCWTIVSIAKFEYHYHEPLSPSCTTTTIDDNAPEITTMTTVPTTTMPTSPPPSPPRRIIPLPLITHLEYYPHQNNLILMGQHLAQHATGRSAPLLRLVLDLPPTQDLLVAHHNVLVTRSDGSRYIELPLILTRQDGASFMLGKALACDILSNGDISPWFVVNAGATVASPSFSS
ncbi:beta-trefoil DNA-binding domain-containing protein [Dichotomocladium elegans]|nr:beta-trefoil DNA-binding domain-containing protein [Dichotomocladium elegans]